LIVTVTKVTELQCYIVTMVNIKMWEEGVGEVEGSGKGVRNAAGRRRVAEALEGDV
jgi:hypothetical protein